uniref:Ras association domain family member 11 n=1 Tax=Sinocyclocheilus anshuiensis TaxID=1608454 RepID=A0A671L7Y3_9TELE
MEVKVYVEGVQRIVCGVTDKTTCQEVVIALARALGRTGRYTLREKFKEYERNVTPDERLLESLEKYGEQAKEVQLTLKHISPSLGEETNQGSGAIALHRQSLPPLSHLCIHSEPPPEEPKRPKRKSLTILYMGGKKSHSTIALIFWWLFEDRDTNFFCFYFFVLFVFRHLFLY